MAVAIDRNQFLYDAGLFGLDFTSAGCFTGPRKSFAKGLPDPVAKEIAKRKGIEGTSPSIILDIGGEGKYNDAYNVNIGAYRGGKTVPNLIAGIQAGFKLPFADKSVTRVTIENTFPFIRGKDREQLVNELARIMQTGGKVIVRQVYDKDLLEDLRDFWGDLSNKRTKLFKEVVWTPNPWYKKEKEKGIEIVIIEMSIGTLPR